MWLNGYNSDQFIALTCAPGYPAGTLALMGVMPGYYGYESPTTEGIAEFTTAAGLATAVKDFVAAAGWPWIIVGDLSTLTISSSNLAAINFQNALSFGDSSPGGSGVSVLPDFNTPGYEPWTNFATAEAGLLELLGAYTIDGS